MASRKEEREQLRQARLEREQEQAKEQRHKLMIGYLVAGVLGLVVIVGIVVVVASSGGGSASGGAHIDDSAGSTNGVSPDDRAGTTTPPAKVTDLATAAKQAGCILRLHLTDEGHDHIPPGSPTPHYKTNPPTSGSHVQPPYQQADGAYSQMPAEIDFVHSLEHGRMEIQYSPKLAQSDQLALKGLFDTEYAGALMFPNDKMPYQVAATTWTNLLGCPTYKGAITLDAIRDFGKKTWGKYGGEPVNAFPFTGPTPANPQ